MIQYQNNTWQLTWNKQMKNYYNMSWMKNYTHVHISIENDEKWKIYKNTLFDVNLDLACHPHCFVDNFHNFFACMKC